MKKLKGNVEIYGSNAIYVPQQTEEKKKLDIKLLLIGVAITSFLVSFAIFGLIKAIGGSDSIDGNISYIQVHVEQGDTFWGLVRRANPEYSGDIRTLVYKATERNEGMLKADSIVEIPVIKEVK